MKRFSVLVTNHLVPEAIEQLKSRYDITENYGISVKDLEAVIGHYDVLLCRGATNVTKQVIDAASRGRLKLIVSATSGLDHIDLESAQQSGITICHTPDAVTNANAEYNISMIIALSRKLRQATEQVCSGAWDQQAILGDEIKGKTLGLIGFGRIGQLTAKYASVFDMNILAYDPYVDPNIFLEHNVTSKTLESLLSESDFVILNLPRTSETKNLITKRELALMRSTSHLVQVSRGGIVNEEDLIDALQQGQIAGACIDVFEREPDVDPRFKKLPNVMLSPHMGCSTYESRYNAGMLALQQINQFFAREPLLHLANYSLKPRPTALTKI
ncbi:MAG: NAD(P)-dependent oxidoreductase [Candidatus Saccharimonadales bacterium]